MTTEPLEEKKVEAEAKKLTVKEVAQRLGFHPASINKFIQTGKLKGEKVATEKKTAKYLVEEAEVERFAKELEAQRQALKERKIKREEAKQKAKEPKPHFRLKVEKETMPSRSKDSGLFEFFFR